MTERTDAELTKLAAQVMGWTVVSIRAGKTYSFPEAGTLFVQFSDGSSALWPEGYLGSKAKSFGPLESISDAWMLVEKSGGMWICPAENGHGWRSGILATEDPGCESGTYADTAPRAITMAAISAMEKETAKR